MAGKTKTPMAEKVKEHATDVAEDAREKVAEKARTEAENLRNAAAEETQKAANAAEAAASEFDSESLQAQAIEQVASRIEDIAAQIRGSDIDRLARTVRQAAERNPLMFVAGAAVAGFALTRFLKARDSNAGRGYRYDDDPWSDDIPPRPTSAGSHDLASRGSI